MASYKEQLQKVWHLYEAQHAALPSTTRVAVAWGRFARYDRNT